MIEKWKLALKEFLRDYEEDDDVIGAILYGSYASDNYNENSDIDVYLILKDSVNYHERGNIESNSYLIEYFKNPVRKIKDYMEDEFSVNKLVTANMFAYGKIIYDVEGKVKELQDLALEYIDKPLKHVSSNKLDNNNYHIWNYLDELKIALKEERSDFNLIYYHLLDYIYDAYLEYLSLPKIPRTKRFKILTDENYRKNYHIFKLPEKEFIKLYLNCFIEDKKSNMFKNINDLVDYYYKKQGGFNIRNFNMKEKI